MEKVFNNNVWSLIGLVLLLVFLVIIFTVAYFILCLLKAFDHVSLAKTAIIVKLLQIPSYVVIFILGLLFLIAIFTVRFTIALFMFYCVILFLSGLLSVAAIMNANRREMIIEIQAIVFGILQFIFVADVISTIILYRKLSKKKKDSQTVI